MSQYFFLIIFTLSTTLSFGQKTNERELYTFLKTKIKEPSFKNDSIVIIENTKSCFGSTSNMVLKSKGSFIVVVFYVDSIAKSLIDSSEYITHAVVDTSFSLPVKTFLKNLDNEIGHVQNGLVISNTTTEYIISQGDAKKKIRVENGQSISYWLRYNRW